MVGTMVVLLNRTGFSDIPSISSGTARPARSRNVGVYHVYQLIVINGDIYKLTRSMFSAM